MDTLDGLRTVIAVVESGSFTAASERLGMSKALVSKYVGEVEAHLAIRLFNRSTRRLALTEAGERYYRRALPLLEEFAALADSVGDEQAPRGLLRVSVPVTFGEMKLSPLLPGFLERYPDIQIDLQLTDRKIDMLEAGIDLVIRIGGVDDSSLIARQINTLPLVLCASPGYIARHGSPGNIQELALHQCIIDSNFAIGRQWPLTSPQQISETVAVQSRIAVNSPSAVKAMVLAGGGIGLIPRFIVEAQLASGALQPVLPDHSTLSFGLFAIYPHRRYLPIKVRCFIDFLLDAFQQAA